MTKEQKEKPYPTCKDLKTGEPTQRTKSPRALTETTKQPEGAQASTRSSSTTAAKHPPETTNKQRNHDGKASIKVGAARAAKYSPDQAKQGSKASARTTTAKYPPK